MNDRELLELAAKAAGLKLPYFIDSRLYGTGLHDDDPDGGLWNPLTDDGDALRLAVKLGMGVRSYSTLRHSQATVVPQTLPGEINVVEFHEGDDYAATRRAIVRAAAEVGRQMPPRNKD